LCQGLCFNRVGAGEGLEAVLTVWIPARRTLHIVALGLLAALAVLALDRAMPLLMKLRPHPEPVATSGAPRSYDEAIRKADMTIEGDEDIARGRDGEWLIEERLANAFFARARLTGSFDDYAAAQKALDQAFATAPKGVGPHLTQAMLDFSMHRLSAAEAMITQIEYYVITSEAETRSQATAMRGDIAFYRGDYAKALHDYTSGRDAKDIASSFRLAVYQSKTGQSDKAIATIDTLATHERFPTAQLLCNLSLMQGAIELQRGNWDKATEYFQRADRQFPGYWLVRGHLAQMLAMSGKRQDAIRQYEAIERGNESPEVMDALAGLYRAEGDRQNSIRWADRAGVVWERRLRQMPEGAYGHAVEHYLAFGDPGRALELAMRDYRARPYGASATALAWAYIANNRPTNALRVIDPVLRSVWVSAEEHIVAGQAHLLLGQSEAADAEQQTALAINPRSMDREAGLIWFGH
jgi:tetratricopeptide (TPR) repeat protein